MGADPADLVYIPNATTGVNLVARGLPLEPGDEVLATDHEYAPATAPGATSARRGASYVRRSVPLPIESPEGIVEAV